MIATSVTASTLDQTRQLAAWLEGADVELPVPTCPGWTLAHLVEHVGATQRWVTRLVAERIGHPAAAFGVAWEQAPADRGAWPAWLVAGARDAEAAIAGAAAGAQVFDPSGGGDGVAFWSLRLFGEISVHRIDAAATLGQPYELEPVLAAAAVDDWLGTMASSGWAANVPGFADAMAGNGETIAWVADDADRAWLLRRTDAPLVLVRERGAADATIHGPANELLQIVSRRRSLDGAEACVVEGDRDELVHLIEHMTWLGAS
ncbi:MAG TPA: maleylpyruvate isomerase family mycothiol-dependent enzyme [Friedmanniella sp.]